MAAGVRIDGFRQAVARAASPTCRATDGRPASSRRCRSSTISPSPRVGRDVRVGLISKPQRREALRALTTSALSIVAPRPAGADHRAVRRQPAEGAARPLRWRTSPTFLLLNDPTRGVDIATRHVLYGVFRDLAGEGMALVMLSTEIEEILRSAIASWCSARTSCSRRCPATSLTSDAGDRRDVRQGQ